MALIKLFSGMDFSGKSTTVQNLSIEMPGKFKCQQKFITPIQTLQEMIDNNIWIPRKDFIPLLQEMVLTVLTSCKINSRFQRIAYLCGFCVLYR